MNISKPVSIAEEIALIRWGSETLLTENELVKKLEAARRDNRCLKIKLGVDPTAPDIHLGHTVVLRKLRQFQDLGHEAILIIGGFTARIGDPSGKSKTRPPLSEDEIRQNAATYLEQVKKILLPERLRVVDNSEWLDKLDLKKVLKLLSQATMAKVLEHNTFRDRFESDASIRMHEFIYPFMQAYDSIHLEADVELGGSDQLFNIAFGRELQRDYGQEPQCALLFPILTGTDGIQKMSKSLDNYIGVNESPRVIYQKIRNMPDQNIIPYFKLLTPLEPDAVIEMAQQLEAGMDTQAILELKDRLADTLIDIFHPGSSRKECATLVIGPSQLVEGRLPLVKALTLSRFAASNREAVQFIENGAVKLNGERIQDRRHTIQLKGDIQLSVGKKKFIMLVYQPE